MKTTSEITERGLMTQLTKLENKFEQGLLTRLNEKDIQRMEARLCDFYGIDDLSLVYGTKCGARFMRLRMRIVEEANEATGGVA